MLKFENRRLRLFSNVHCLEHMAVNLLVGLTDLFEVTYLHNHGFKSLNENKIILSNQINRKSETSTCEVFNECFRYSIGASSVTIKKMESSMFKRRKIQPKIPSSAH